MILDSMQKALEPIKLYDTEAPQLTAELRAYADELEILNGELSSLICERFVYSATEYGISRYEEMFGPVRDDLSLSERRRLLRLRLTQGNGDFTPAGIRQALDSFGLEYVISEFPTFDRVNVIAQTDYNEAQRSFIKREVGKIMPAHVEYQMVFNTLTWDELDARDKTFSGLDNDDLTWESFDELS